MLVKNFEGALSGKGEEEQNQNIPIIETNNNICLSNNS